MTAPAASTPAKPVSVWEDFVDIFYAPTQVFERRRDGKFGLALLVLTVLAVIIYFATRGGMEAVMDVEFQRKAAEQMAKNPKITPEMMEKGRALSEKIAWLLVLVGIPVRAFVVGVVLWLLGKIVGATESIAAAVMVSTYALFPRLLESLIAGVQGIMMDPNSITSRYSVTLSAARFLDPTTTNPILFKLAGQVDVFAIWTTILLAIGLAVTGRVSRGKAFAIAFVIWLLGAFFG
ncbi:MAG TPA: YIP1 family protein [Gemmatimonadaceae bacterium]|nr:YIP1 family protein [Gemmatimonadaceae bacterium]